MLLTDDTSASVRAICLLLFIFYLFNFFSRSSQLAARSAQLADVSSQNPRPGVLMCLLGFWPSGPKPCGGKN